MNHYVGNPFQSPVILSVCPGFRGLERGLERAIGHFTTAAYVEIEAFIVANLVAAMEEGVLAAAPIWTDLKTFKPQRFFNKIHGLTGGYPCQPFSFAGVRKGTEDPRHLWPHIQRIIAAARPVWCFFENVPGHLTMGFDRVYTDLADLGYAVEAGIYSAQEVGAPHERDRLYIFAILADTDLVTSWDVPGNDRTQFSDTGHHGSPAMADADDNAGERIAGIVQRAQETVERKAQGKDRKWVWPGLANSRKNVAHPFIQRFQEYRDRTFTSLSKHTGLTGDGIDRWPAFPGQQQFDWEERRNVEPGVGCTINGYNFREDLVRAIGNMVVEQTAELAFLDLLSKILSS